MNHEEIIEGNKLIAEFDGWKFIQTKVLDADTSLPFYKKFENDKLVHNGIYHHPEYHNNWSTLMPVVEKIAAKKVSVQIDIVRNNCECTITPVLKKDISGKVGILIQNTDNKIEAVWLAVVEFIKWYNQNKLAQ